MKRERIVAGLLAWLLVSGGAGRLWADAGELFGLTNLWTFHLTLSRTNWAALEPVELGRDPARPPLRDAEPRPPGPGAFEREYPWSNCTVEAAGLTLTNVAIRFKGNSSFNLSRGGLKRPFKLDFDRGAKGRKFLGVEELFLNNNANDATQLREALAYDVCRRAGLPAPRTAFAKVFLTVTGERTNQFLGLYTLVEAVEGDFLRAHFGTKQGLLLKPERLRSLDYLRPDWAAYTNRYDPKSGVKPVDAERFIALTRLIAEADDATLFRELPPRLDLENFLRYVAVTAVLANYDSFIGNGHNYYFFQPRKARPAVFIPWDFNEAFGGHPMAGARTAQAELSVLRPAAEGNRLLERVLARPEWAAAYRRELATLLTNACEPGRLRADAERIAGVTRDAVFAESPQAQAAFQRIALGQTNVMLPRRGGARGPGEGGPPPGGPGPEDRPRRPEGPGLGPGPGREDLPLADWITLRMKNVAEELAGNRTGTVPSRQRGPGGPGGPRRPGQPQLGGPGGLVPPPR